MMGKEDKVFSTPKVKEFLDSIYDRMSSGDVRDGMERLFNGLHELRQKTPESKWRSLVDTIVLKHALREIIFKDPITHWSYQKPRGYAGDAVLLDMIYLHQSNDFRELCLPGKQIYQFMTNVRAAQAVRDRKIYIANEIDALCAIKEKPRILSLACGHLREAELSDAVRGKAMGEFYAVDQDERSLQVVRDQFGGSGVSVMQVSVRDIIRKKVAFDEFDLIYTSGLYDYLAEPVACKLTLRLFNLLTSGGKLLITNFLHNIDSIGYMESFMHWHLIFRDESEIVRFAKDIPRKQIEKTEIFIEKHENIGFLKIHKG